METLSLVGKIVGTFLLKSTSGLSNQAMLNAFETIDAWIYVIDGESHEILYMNRKTRDMEQTGDGSGPCHVVLRGKSAPCADCPVEHLRNMPEGETSAAALYNEQYALRVWTTARRVRWYGNDNACIICCQDITEFTADARPPRKDEAR